MNHPIPCSGIAQIMGFGAHVAAAAEVSVTERQLKIHRIVAATGPAHVVNPQQVQAQITGPAPSSAACRPRCTASAPSRTGVSSKATSSTTT